MNLVDSSGWLEYFAGGANASFFSAPLNKPRRLIVPTVCLYEVFKRIHQQRGESAALQAASIMQEGQIVELDPPLALSAARLSLELKLPMADSIIYATAKAWRAVLWTQDDDFESIPEVQYTPKQK